MKVSKEFKIGFFVVIVLVASFFVINYLRGKDVFNREKEYYCYYDNLETLTVSAPVMVRGYKAGSVTDVEYLPESDNFKVTISVDKRFKVSADAKMALFSTSIMGGKGIEIVGGESEELAEDGAQLQPDSMVDLVASVTENIGPLMEKLQGLADSLTTTISGVNSMMSEDNLAAVNSSLMHVKRSLRNVENITSTIDGSSVELENFIKNVSSMSNKFEPLMDSADSVLTGMNGVVAQINRAEIDGLVASLKALSDKIQDPSGSTGKLMSDQNLYISINDLINRVSSLISEIEKNPKKYIKVSVF